MLWGTWLTIVYPKWVSSNAFITVSVVIVPCPRLAPIIRLRLQILLIMRAVPLEAFRIASRALSSKKKRNA